LNREERQEREDSSTNQRISERVAISASVAYFSFAFFAFFAVRPSLTAAIQVQMTFDLLVNILRPKWE
jgi:hypothetical protein